MSGDRQLPALQPSAPLSQPLDELIAEADEKAQEAWAKSTRRAYKAQTRLWVAWCRAHDVSAVPAAVDHVRAYLLERSKTVKPATVKVAAQAIRQLHENNGLLSPTTHSQVKRLLQAIQNQGVPADKAAAIRLHELHAAVDGCPRSPAGLRDRALLLVGFTAALRRSETAAIEVEHLTFLSDRALLMIPHSKTDQAGQGVRVSLAALPGLPDYCPMTALRAWLTWLATVGIERGPVFWPVDRHGNLGIKPMSGRAVAEVIKRRVRPVAASPDTVRGHSLRAGYVTEAAALGIEGHRIKRQSRHKTSEAMEGYIREGELLRDATVRRVIDPNDPGRHNA